MYNIKNLKLTKGIKIKYNFEKNIDRTGTHIIAIDNIPISNAKVDEKFDKISMWIADMNFETVPTVKEEMIKRANYVLYGYFNTPDKYYAKIY